MLRIAKQEVHKVVLNNVFMVEAKTPKAKAKAKVKK